MHECTCICIYTYTLYMYIYLYIYIYNEWHAIALTHAQTLQYSFRHAIIARAKLYMTSLIAQTMLHQMYLVILFQLILL